MWFQGQTGRWPEPSAREPHTPAVLTERPIALRRFTARQDRFTLGLRLDECSFSPGVQKRNNFPEHPLTNHAIWHLILN